MAAAFRGYVFGEAGTGYRRHYTENVAGAVKGIDGLWLCGKEILRVVVCAFCLSADSTLERQQRESVVFWRLGPVASAMSESVSGMRSMAGAIMEILVKELFFMRFFSY